MFSCQAPTAHRVQSKLFSLASKTFRHFSQHSSPVLAPSASYILLSYPDREEKRSEGVRKPRIRIDNPPCGDHLCRPTVLRRYYHSSASFCLRGSGLVEDHTGREGPWSPPWPYLCWAATITPKAVTSLWCLCSRKNSFFWSHWEESSEVEQGIQIPNLSAWTPKALPWAPGPLQSQRSHLTQKSREREGAGVAGRFTPGQQDQGALVKLLLMDFRGATLHYPTAQVRNAKISALLSWCQGKIISAPCSEAFWLPCPPHWPGKTALLHLVGQISFPSWSISPADSPSPRPLSLSYIFPPLVRLLMLAELVAISQGMNLCSFILH